MSGLDSSSAGAPERVSSPTVASAEEAAATLALLASPKKQNDADAALAKEKEADDAAELAQLQKECRNMMEHIKDLGEEEQSLNAQNRILAREALACGFDPSKLEPPAKRGGGRKKKSASPVPPVQQSPAVQNTTATVAGATIPL